MGAKQSKKPPRPTSPDRALYAPTIAVAPSRQSVRASEEWTKINRARSAGTPFYALSRGSATGTLSTEQILTLEPIGQVTICLDASAQTESEFVKHTYRWPLPTGDLERLADKAIWECTELTVSAPSAGQVYAHHTTALIVPRAAAFMPLHAGSAVTLKYAHKQASDKKITLVLRDLEWDMLGARIMRALENAKTHASWLQTLKPEEQLKFGTELKTAKAMTQHIYRVVLASASQKPDF